MPGKPPTASPSSSSRNNNKRSNQPIRVSERRPRKAIHSNWPQIIGLWAEGMLMANAKRTPNVLEGAG
jgi:hypothetical protein